MSISYVISPTKCPKCGERKVYPQGIHVMIDGKGYYPSVPRCKSCGFQYQTDKEAAREQFKSLMKRN